MTLENRIEADGGGVRLRKMFLMKEHLSRNLGGGEREAYDLF